MATTAVDSGVLASRTRADGALPTHFFTYMAVACLAVAVIGFAPSYWIPLTTGRPTRIPPVLHLHGLLFSLWTVYFVWQSATGSAGSIARHRRTGMIGISLATAMVIIGPLAAHDTLQHQVGLGYGEGAMRFTIVPLMGILVFAVLFVAAIATSRDRETHKRLMLVNTVGLLNAAAGRLFVVALAPPQIRALAPQDRPPIPVIRALGAGLAVDLLIVFAMIADWRYRGRVHRAYSVGGAILLASQVLRGPLSETAAWHAIASGFLALGG